MQFCRRRQSLAAAAGEARVRQHAALVEGKDRPVCRRRAEQRRRWKFAGWEHGRHDQVLRDQRTAWSLKGISMHAHGSTRRR